MKNNFVFYLVISILLYMLYEKFEKRSDIQNQFKLVKDSVTIIEKEKEKIIEKVKEDSTILRKKSYSDTLYVKIISLPQSNIKFSEKDIIKLGETIANNIKFDSSNKNIIVNMPIKKRWFKK